MRTLKGVNFLRRGGVSNRVDPNALESQPSEAPASPPAIAALFRQHFDFVWRTLRSFGVPLEAVDDAVQEVFLTVHRRLPEFEWRSSTQTWIYSIAYLTAQNHRRKSQRRQHEELGDEHRATEPDPGERLAGSQAGKFVGQFVEGLPSEKRDVFVFCVLEELTAPEAASILHVNVNTVYSRLRLVRAEFRTALERFALQEKVS